ATANGTILTWTISSLTPDEETSFAFGAEAVQGYIEIDASGEIEVSTEVVETLNLHESVEGATKEYERIDLLGEGYISHIEFDIEIAEDNSRESDTISDPGPSGGSGKASRTVASITGAAISFEDTLKVFINTEGDWNGNQTLLGEVDTSYSGTISADLEPETYYNKFYFIFRPDTDVDIEINTINITREVSSVIDDSVELELLISDGNVTFELANIDVLDADGNVVNCEIKILNSVTKVPLSEFGIMSKDLAGDIEEGYYDVELIPEEGPIEKMYFEDVHLLANETVNFKIDNPTDNEEFTELYAIDPTLINFIEAEVTVTAKGTALQKCKDWNFIEQTCEGSWEFLKTITPGEIYTFTLTPEDPGFAETNCTYRRNFTFNNAHSSENLTDFPVLVVLNSSRIDYSSTNETDIRFYDSDGSTLLAHEIELWNESGDSYIWIGVPQIDAGSTTDNIAVYYECTDSAVQNVTGVWDANYVMVQHMQETSGIHYDSTSYGNNGTNSGTTQDAVGKIDGANYFSSGDYIDVTDSSSLEPTDAVTVEAWANSTGVQYGNIFSNTEYADVWGDGYVLWYNSNTEIRFAVNDYTANDATSSITSANMNYIAGTYDKDAGSNQVKIYVNSVLGTSASEIAVISYDAAAKPTMNDAGTNSQLVGIIDEVRVSNISRSADWINASYLTMSDNFINYGGEELGNAVPTHTTPVLNSTSDINTTSENLTCYNQTTNDTDGDPVKNIYNWDKNGTSLAVLNMPFEGGSNSTYTKDYSGNSNDGIVNGSTWNSTGGYDGKGAFEFDDVDDYIETGLNLSDMNTDWSFSAWIKGNIDTDEMCIFGEDGVGSNLCMGRNNDLLWLRATGITNFNFLNTNISDNDWHHVVFLGNSTDTSAYLDGTLGEVVNESLNLPNRELLWIGGQAGTSRYWNGTIDDVRVYNYSLSAEQILELYNNKTNLIVSNETTFGDNWTCEVTPNDGYEDGTTLESNSLLISLPDSTPPASVTGLNNQSATFTSIYWNWTNPSDPDFSENIIYINGSNVANTSNNYYNATGLTNSTIYVITVHTKDTTGNVNDTDVNDTANTLVPDITSPTYSSEAQNPSTPAIYSFGGNYQFNITWIDVVAVDEVVLEFNGTNYSYLDSDISKSGNEYYITLADLAVNTGGYSYKWYANDTADNWNVTGALTYVINKADNPVNLYFNGTQNSNRTYTYPEVVNT
ncbi:MAG: DUF2341 domain-containing protein, partial [Candidatus Aenigmarchaeota archaeon]|nr:DUF2341 domain-containing protein [Candidatus Aenigmarchaeota archaeon]